MGIGRDRSTKGIIRTLTAAGVAFGMLFTGGALAEEDPSEAAGSSAEVGGRADGDERLDDIEEKVQVLAEEIGRLESIFVVPEEVRYDSFSGLGPAASKVYKRDRGLSIGGYGEVRLRHFYDTEDDDKDDIFDALRGVLYVGYKFNDNWVVNSEFEFEHAGSGGGGSASIEFMTVDYLWKEELNARAGLVLIPMGFVNEIHEPTSFFGAERPEVERLIMPSTWRENGAGIFGTVAEHVQYRAYAVNGFDGSGFSSSGLRGGRQKGSEALANDFAFVGRVDVIDVVPGLLFGGSVWVGQSGQDQDKTVAGVTRDLPDALTTIYEVHAQYRGHGASLRALWTQAFIDEAGRLSRVLGKGLDPATGLPVAAASGDSIAQEMQGWYVEAAYDVLPLIVPDTKMSLEPYFRFEHFNTQKDVSDSIYTRNKNKDVDLYVVGVQYKPIPNIVFKLDTRIFEPDQGDRSNEVQALVGFAF